MKTRGVGSGGHGTSKFGLTFGEPRFTFVESGGELGKLSGRIVEPSLGIITGKGIRGVLKSMLRPPVIIALSGGAPVRGIMANGLLGMLARQ